MSALTTRQTPRRIVRARDLYALEESDSELIESLDFNQQCVMIRARLNLPCDPDGTFKPRYYSPALVLLTIVIIVFQLIRRRISQADQPHDGQARSCSFRGHMSTIRVHV